MVLIHSVLRRDPATVWVRATPELGPGEGGVAQGGIGAVVGGQHCLSEVGWTAVGQPLDVPKNREFWPLRYIDL